MITYSDIFSIRGVCWLHVRKTDTGNHKKEPVCFENTTFEAWGCIEMPPGIFCVFPSFHDCGNTGFCYVLSDLKRLQCQLQDIFERLELPVHFY